MKDAFPVRRKKPSEMATQHDGNYAAEALKMRNCRLKQAGIDARKLSTDGSALLSLCSIDRIAAGDLRVLNDDTDEVEFLHDFSGHDERIEVPMPKASCQFVEHGN